jgi:hypothetical protein
MQSVQPTRHQEGGRQAGVRGEESYVGETARLVGERAAEQWTDADSGKEESHMLEHQVETHGGEDPPQFAFKVVKNCNSSLERQVREAIRI